MIRLVVEDEDLKELARRLRRLEDGKELRKQLVSGLRTAVKPAVDAAKSSIRSAPTRVRHRGPSIRSAIARAVSVQVRTSGRTAGVRVRTRKTPGVRGFDNAPKRFNRASGWRHPRFGDREAWVHQTGKPDWFDKPMRDGRPRYRRAVIDVMNDTARKAAGK